MSVVTSRDGTSIAYTRRGSGPPLILTTGALDDGSENEPLAEELAGSFTTFNYSRRGRGDSGDTQPYALERELEDLDALIAEAGGRAHLYGVSSGGALALEAAAAGLVVDRLAVYEVPWFVEDEPLRYWREYVAELGPAIDGGEPGAPLELFHRLTGFSDEDIAAARSSPDWAGAQSMEGTLAYDAAVIGDGRPPLDRLARVDQTTLVATGGWIEFMESAADAIAAALPNGERRVLEGQGHEVDAQAMARLLEAFLA
jgi:pimeloyl-ACP methyl ester carboxylesterase